MRPSFHPALLLLLLLTACVQVRSDWGEWSEASACSRTCGGGVQYRDRYCATSRDDGEPDCAGPSRSFSSCNTQECGPDAIDYRLEQCQSYNNVSFEGTYYEWQPYYGAEPCALTCLAVGETFYYRHAARVVDGTPCTHDDNDVCVDGTCQPVGCDGQLGSGLQEDPCGICGGDSATCRLHSGVIRTTTMQKGYNDALLIPEGATSIVIREEEPSRSALALRDMDGVFYLNGRWTVTRPSQLDIGGTTWLYNRTNEHHELLTARGPTNESLMLALVQQPSHTTPVKYRFYLPVDVGAIHSGRGYHWRTSTWSPCNTPCGLGEQVRTASCFDSYDGLVADELCDVLAKPDSSQQCHTSACDTQWYTSDWGPCSSSCGAGLQARSLVCRRLLDVDQQLYSIAPDTECMEDMPITLQECNHNASCPIWQVGTWLNCDRACGNGEQSRTVTCQSPNTTQPLPLNSCDMKTKPNSSQPCNLGPCEGVEWMVSQWSGCRGTCDSGYESRHAMCASKLGHIHSDDLCKPNRRPRVRRSCSHDDDCKPHPKWFSSEWLPCSSGCGSGFQSRRVVCAIEEGRELLVLADADCDISNQPASEQMCEGMSCEGVWFTAPYSKCSAKCGGGIRRREVMCFHDNQVVNHDLCDGSRKPRSSQDCNLHACDEDDFIINRNCENSLYGCCPDGSTPAEGPHYYGCLLSSDGKLDGNCEDEEHGCCPDGVTVARGPFKEGCPEFNCTGTEFGCCPDGVTHAGGINGEGCSTDCGVDGEDCGGGSGETQDAGIPGCHTTLFGCCPDGLTAASGPDDSGCDASCAASLYGCCPDGISPATGPNLLGCSAVFVPDDGCHGSLYGCCPDGETAALGPDAEGCGDKVEIECGNTVFGCCPDGIHIAYGINNEGCEVFGGCADTRYGCCSDGLTTAIGPNSLGCSDSGILSCTQTMYGCCPDNTTSASGPGFMGCPDISHVEHSCEATSFGCCPDGVTTATGPLFQGCVDRGSYVESCADSGYGCCPDGIGSSRGPNYAGCQDVIERGAICGFDKDLGTCSNYQVMWYFDPTYGECTRFWFGGCHGNGNRFASREECRGQCVSPPGLGKCYLPMSTGRCRAGMTKYYYDPVTQSCQQFVYGDCWGNDNRFDTLDECVEECVAPHQPDICLQPEIPGPCQGQFTRWYYDQTHDTCREFTYGGCLGNDNRFPSEVACENRCKQPADAVCSMESEVGPCHGSYVQWYFNTTTSQCQQFVYGGCNGNANRFHSLEECNMKCEQLMRKNVDACTLHMDAGPCTGYFKRWYHDKSDGVCKEFVYGGCHGNNNRFNSVLACRESCNALPPTDVCLLPLAIGACDGNTTQKTWRYYFDQAFGQCRQFLYSGCQGNDNNFGTMVECQKQCSSLLEPTPPASERCIEAAETGPCIQRLQRWYYNTQQRTCLSFNYGGCQGNRNRFLTRQACLSECEPVSLSTTLATKPTPTAGFGTITDGQPMSTHPITGSPQDICSLPQDAGMCDGYEPAWYYDELVNECLEFIYGGCGGNLNRFGSLESCRSQCRTNRVAVSGLAICGLPHDRGVCQGSYTRWHYDHQLGQCRSFTYGGCNGNENNFLTEETCQTACPLTDICVQPSDQGPCKAVKYRFHFDPAQGRCAEFLWGGCGGNGNRFLNYESCMRVCGSPQSQQTPTPSSKCMQPMDSGPCQAQMKMYYYDVASGSCRQFVYGGCQGNENRFRSMAGCAAFCERMTTPTLPTTTPTPSPTSTLGTLPYVTNSDVCQMKKKVGHCMKYTPVWYYESNSHSCRRFLYGGCGGNGNRFEHREECMRACVDTDSTSTTVTTRRTTTPATPTPSLTPPVIDREAICTLPLSDGHCENGFSHEIEERWHYNHENNTCSAFTYVGCNGNTNNFPSQLDCMSFCVPDWAPQSDGGSGELLSNKKPEECSMVPRQGPCQAAVLRWYYDADSNTCKDFIYGGCQGNANNFASHYKCETKCKDFIVQEEEVNVCEMSKLEGPCQAQIIRWYYDRDMGTCLQFQYGGCQGNMNNFESYDDCAVRCESEVRADSGIPTDICSLKKEKGPCFADYLRFYYDDETQECRPFLYGGCQGNGNNFGSQEACHHSCGYGNNYRLYKPGDCYEHRDPGPCQDGDVRYYFDASIGNCEPFHYGGCEGNQNNFRSYDDCLALCSRVSETCGVLLCDLECQHGYGRGIDGCLTCECVDPCKDHECPEDQECVVNAPVCITAPCPRARAVCRHKPKPGRCLALNSEVVGGCVEKCSEDIECPSSLKCCANGCGHVCLRPVFPGCVSSMYGCCPGSDTFATGWNFQGCPEEAPIIADYETDVKAIGGESLTILCSATGSPPPQIFWFKNREALTNFNGRIEYLTSGAIRINNVTETDGGVYSCRAYNGVGSATRTYTVSVQVPVMFLDTPAEYTVRQGATLRMECMAVGVPSPTIRWLRNNQLVLIDKEHVEQQEEGTLVISSALVEDTGVYMCEASNGVGQPSLRMVTVKVLGTITVKIVVSNTTFISGSDARMVCEVKGDTEVRFEWNKDGSPLPFDLRYRTTRQGELLIEDVIPTDSGEYTCIVTRKFEVVRGSAHIQVSGATLPADCGDQPFYADCLLIIRARMCRHKYFREFCCKTCHEHGHLP